MSVAWHEFERIVKTRGLTPVDHGYGHWQIVGGGFLVNFYPETKRGSVFCVAGMKGIVGGLEAAIAAAAEPVPAGKGTRKGQSYHQRMRRRLLKRDPHCYLCGCELNERTATLDHYIPISKGGHEGQDNCRVACEGCNLEKSDTMPTAEVVRESVPVEVYEWV